MRDRCLLPADHADVGESYNNLASVYNRLGEYNQAKELPRKSTDDLHKNFW